MSNVPTQALVTLNDPAFASAALAFAERLLGQGNLGDVDRIGKAFRLALGRRATPSEVIQFCHFLDRQRRRGSDELAVWSATTAVLLNLDEFLCRP